jgi:hypothetical protein
MEDDHELYFEGGRRHLHGTWPWPEQTGWQRKAVMIAGNMVEIRNM